MMNAQEIIELRQRLNMDKPTFAKLLSADARSVTRWENDGSGPSGAAEAIMIGIRESLAKNPNKADALIQLILSAVPVGGLSYLIIKLLDMVSLTPIERARP